MSAELDELRRLIRKGGKGERESYAAALERIVGERDVLRYKLGLIKEAAKIVREL